MYENLYLTRSVAKDNTHTHIHVIEGITKMNTGFVMFAFFHAIFEYKIMFLK